MKNQIKQRILNLFIILTITLLSACVEEDMTDLKRYVARIKKQGNPPIDPIPEYKHIPNYHYDVDKLRDPFIPFIQKGEKRRDIIIKGNESGTSTRNCRRKPNFNRVRVGLELIPLDALEMVGTLEVAGTLWVLVASKTDGAIYQVKQHDYIGINYGKIINLTHTQIDVLEQLPDEKGCWTTETTTITRIEQ